MRSHQGVGPCCLSSVLCVRRRFAPHVQMGCMLAFCCWEAGVRHSYRCVVNAAMPPRRVAALAVPPHGAREATMTDRCDHGGVSLISCV